VIARFSSRAGSSVETREAAREDLVHSDLILQRTLAMVEVS